MNHVEVKRRQIQALSEILGLITLLVLGKIIGNNGIAYFAAAYEGMWIFFLLLGEGVPDALGRLLRGRNARNQNKNTAHIRKKIMILQCLLGLAGCAGLVLLSDLLADRLFQIPYSSFLMKLMAPVIFLRCISGVLQGYFQGNGTEMPTAAACVLRQVMLLGFSILFCNILKNYGGKVSALLRNDNFTSMYGVAGVAISLILTELLILLFMALIYMGSSKKGKHKPDGLKRTESFGEFAKVLYGSMSLTVMVSLFVRLPVWFGLILYQRNGKDLTASVLDYGAYYGKYLVICAFPILLLTACMLPMCARAGSHFRREDYRYGKDVLGAALHFGWVHTVFLSMFLAVLAEQVSEMLFSQDSLMTPQMIRGGSTIIIFSVLSVLFIRIMLIMGKGHLVLISMGISNAVVIIGLMVCLKALSLGIMSLVYAGAAGSGVLCLFTGYLVLKMLRLSPDWIRTILIPGVCAVAAGLACMFIGKALSPHIGNLVTLLLCLFIGVIIYWTALIMLRSFREEELELMPGGKLLHKLARLLHVMD